MYYHETIQEPLSISLSLSLSFCPKERDLRESVRHVNMQPKILTDGDRTQATRNWST